MTGMKQLEINCPNGNNFESRKLRSSPIENDVKGKHGVIWGGGAGKSLEISL